MRVVNFMAKACSYAQEHIDDKDAWPTEPSEREAYLQCVSYQMACFFAQNTRHGGEGVDWDVVIGPLTEHPMKTEAGWERILEEIAKELGGWSTNNQPSDGAAQPNQSQ